MNAADFHSARKFAVTRFGRIAYFERGHGPAALLLHGFPLNGFQWRDVVENLAATRRCIVPDLTGLGYTEPIPSQDLSFVSQADMLDAFLDAMGIDQVDVVGNDSGGGISQVVTATHPRRVRTLTLTNCEVHDRWPNAMLEQLFGLFENRMGLQVLKEMATDLSLARSQFTSVYENPESLTAESARTYFERITSSVERAEMARGFACNWRRSREQLMELAPALKRSEIPAQILWGTADTTFDVEPSLEWLSANLGGLLRVIRIEGAKLFFPEERPHPYEQASPRVLVRSNGRASGAYRRSRAEPVRTFRTKLTFAAPLPDQGEGKRRGDCSVMQSP